MLPLLVVGALRAGPLSAGVRAGVSRRALRLLESMVGCARRSGAGVVRDGRGADSRRGATGDGSTTRGVEGAAGDVASGAITPSDSATGVAVGVPAAGSETANAALLSGPGPAAR
jgi:hypothetical protein